MSQGHSEARATPDAPATSKADAGQAGAPTAGEARSVAGRWLIFFGLALVGGVVGWLLVEISHESFVSDLAVEGQGILTAEQRAAVMAAQVRADYKNAPLAIGLLGLAVTAAIGFAPGLVQRSLGKAVAGSAIGAITGALLGGLGGAAAVFVRERLRGWNTLAETGEPDPLLTQLHTMALHLPSWIGVAVAVGLAVGFSAWRSRVIGRITGVTILAAVVGSLIYPMVAAILFQMEDPRLVIPTGSANRLLWTTLNAGLIGLIVGRPAKDAPAN